MHPSARLLLLFALYLLFLIPYYSLFSSSVEVERGEVDPLLLPVGVVVATALFLLALRLFGRRVVAVVEWVTVAVFLPLFFYPFTRALGIEGFEYALALLTALTTYAFPSLRPFLSMALGAVASSMLAEALPFRDALLMASLMALYDYWAVRKSSVMEKVAKVAVEEDSLMVVKLMAEEKREGAAMGLGDFLVGGLLLLTAYDASPLLALAVYAGLLFGLTLLLRDLPKRGIAPALPYLTGGAVVATTFLYLLSLLFPLPLPPPLAL